MWNLYMSPERISQQYSLCYAIDVPVVSSVRAHQKPLGQTLVSMTYTLIRSKSVHPTCPMISLKLLQIYQVRHQSNQESNQAFDYSTQSPVKKNKNAHRTTPCKQKSLHIFSVKSSHLYNTHLLLQEYMDGHRRTTSINIWENSCDSFAYKQLEVWMTNELPLWSLCFWCWASWH